VSLSSTERERAHERESERECVREIEKEREKERERERESARARASERAREGVERARERERETSSGFKVTVKFMMSSGSGNSMSHHEFFSIPVFKSAQIRMYGLGFRF
jgi:hypothetical protein